MSEYSLQDRLEENRQALRSEKFIFPTTIGLIFVILLFYTGFQLFSGGQDYSMNVFTELLGLLATVLILDRITEFRLEQQLKRRLVREAASRDNSTAISAIDWIQAEGWATGHNSILRGANLLKSNLQNANFRDANLEQAILTNSNVAGVDFRNARLRGAILHNVKLQDASVIATDLSDCYISNMNFDARVMPEVLFRNSEFFGVSFVQAKLWNTNFEGAACPGCNFEDADLSHSNFRNANLTYADLSHARLHAADLRGANLTNARIIGANIEGTKFDETTKLPDGSYYDPLRNHRQLLRFGVMLTNFGTGIVVNNG